MQAQALGRPGSPGLPGFIFRLLSSSTSRKRSHSRPMYEPAGQIFGKSPGIRDVSALEGSIISVLMVAMESLMYQTGPKELEFLIFVYSLHLRVLLSRNSTCLACWDESQVKPLLNFASDQLRFLLYTPSTFTCLQVDIHRVSEYA